MLELPQFATRDARIANYEAVVAFLAPLFATRDRDAWCARLLEHEVPHSAVLTSDEALASPQIRHLEMETSAEHPEMGRFRTIRSPVSFDGERALEVKPPPVLGEHNEAVLGRARDEAAE
jgi:crotonobetainyl-CoA:carnitine CoA-transferase CaiB-like acyl-CoA transferase